MTPADLKDVCHQHSLKLGEHGVAIRANTEAIGGLKTTIKEEIAPVKEAVSAVSKELAAINQLRRDGWIAFLVMLAAFTVVNLDAGVILVGAITKWYAAYRS